MLTLQEINVLCQDLFFPAEPCTIATFITAHTTLYYLFRDLPLKDMEALNLTRSEVTSLVDMCVKNSQTAFSNLRLVMDPTYENIQALMIGVSICLSNSILGIQLTESLSGYLRSGLITARFRMVTHLRCLQTVSRRRLSPSSIVCSRSRCRHDQEKTTLLVHIYYRSWHCSQLRKSPKSTEL